MPDIKTLIIITFFSLLLLCITSLFYYYKLPNRKYTKYFSLFSLLFVLGQVITSFRNVIPDIFPIILGNTLLATGFMFLYIGIRDLLNLEARWHNRYLIPLSIYLLGLILFTFVYYNVPMRITIFSVFFAIYNFVFCLIFWKNRNNEFKILNSLSSIFFFIGVIIFVMRVFKASSIRLAGDYFNTTDIMVILVYLYLLMMSIWLTIILIKYSNQEINKLKSLR